MVVCPKCRYKGEDREFSIESVINGVRIQIKCPRCKRYTCFLDEEYEER